MPRRRSQPKARGFALLVVVLLVALIAVSAVALLDIVQVDLLVVGQHRRTTEAQAAAVGAMIEVVSDDTLRNQLPDLTTPNLAYRYAGPNAGLYMRDPTNRFGTTVMGPTNSAYVRDVGTSLATGYTADVELLRVGPPQDTGTTRAQAVTYEVTVVSDVNNGEATKEVRTQVQRVVAVQSGIIRTNVHAR
jgi:hypothetical protein